MRPHVDLDSVPPTSVPPNSLRGDELGRAHLSTLHEDLTLGRIFTAREAHLVAKVKAYCVGSEGPCARDLGLALDRGFRSLGAIAIALESYPSMRERDTLGQRERSVETLMASVLEGGEQALEWTLPTKAVLSRSFGVAKVNFFSALRYALQIARDPAGAELRSRIEEAIEEAVFTRLAEELYSAFVTNDEAPEPLRRIAMEHLIDMWEGRVRFATYRFCPILRSAWAARARASRVFGTMMGSVELTQLLFQDCDERFLARFLEGEADPERTQAFEEFLFDLPIESLHEVRARMTAERRTCVDCAQVAEYIGCPPSKLPPQMSDPRTFYASFKRRGIHARHRRSTGSAGPKRTAESYVLEALMMEQLEGRTE